MTLYGVDCFALRARNDLGGTHDVLGCVRNDSGAAVRAVPRNDMFFL